VSLFADIATALRVAARDMRGGARSLWLLAAGVFIGTAVVASVGTMSQSLIDGARRGALETVGGDLSLRLSHRPPGPEELAVIGREGTLSVATELRPMAHVLGAVQEHRRSVLVELKGIDGNYPLFGAAQTSPAFDLHQGLARRDGHYGAVADKALFDVLGLAPGDSVRIGGVRYQLRGVLVVEPGRAFRAFTLGPRIIVLNESLAATGLVDEGAEVYHYTHVKLPAGANGPAEAKAALTRIDRAHPLSGWRMVNAHEGIPGVERTLAMAQVLLLFIGLGVMLVGGGGIAGAVRAHTSEKMETIAILKSVGARPAVVTLAVGFEVMTAAAIGTVFGVGVGALSPTAVAAALADQLPFALDAAPAVKPLVAAALFGVLVAALFAWWPLMGVHDMKARVLLRQDVSHDPRRLGRKRWLGAALILSAVIALVFWVSPMPGLTAGFLLAALVLAAFYFALGIGLSRLAKVLAKGRSAPLRLALGSLHRAGAPTGPVVMALGLSLTLLVALDGIGTAANRHVEEAMPGSAPDLVAFSMKPKTAARLDADLAAAGLAENRRIVPFLHARVQALNGIAVRDLDIPGSINWVIRGDRGVSFAADLPDGTCWQASQKERAGYSLDAGIAEKLGLAIGDRITLNVGGQVREGPVVNLRTVDWTRLDLDFPIIATPGTFAGIPYSLAASLKAKPGQTEELEAFLKDRFPDTPLIRVADVLSSLNGAMEAIVTGLQSAALMCGLAAFVVLAGSVLQGLRARTDEAVLFKVLGARRRQLLGHVTLEFLGLGALVAVAAVPLGFLIAVAVAGGAGLGSVSLAWASGVTLAAAATLITLVVGLLATLGAYTTTPARILRNRRP